MIQRAGTGVCIALAAMRLFLSAGAMLASCGGTVVGEAGDAGPIDTGLAADPGDARAEPNIRLIAGGTSTCAMVGSSLECWGDNVYGQLASPPDHDPHPTPSAVPAAGTALASIGPYHACASDGMTTRCWGANEWGELGHAPALDAGSAPPTCLDGLCEPSPAVVAGLGSIMRLAVGGFSSCAVRSSSGSILCWGDDDLVGALGSGAVLASHMSSSPLSVALAARVDEIAMGFLFACARGSLDGRVWCWGWNAAGELGLGGGADSDAHPTPRVVAGLAGVAHLAAGRGHVCALDEVGNVHCWGANLYGELGHDPAAESCVVSGIPVGPCSTSPTPVPGVAHAREIALGDFHSCAVLEDDTLACWGNNEWGQLGRPPGDASLHGLAYDFVAQVVPNLGNVAHVAAGTGHTCVVTRDDRVLCWGDNGWGECGRPPADGGPTWSYVPTIVDGLN